jgi:hypothetical protein
MIELTGGHPPAMKGNNHADRFGCVVVGSNYGRFWEGVSRNNLS